MSQMEIEDTVWMQRPGGWFSMSPLPRLHHYDIMTIVGT